MHTVMWTFKVPAGTSKAQLIETINATAHTYEGIPGLIRKTIHFLRFKDVPTVRQSYANPLADRVWIFTFKRQNIGQKSLYARVGHRASPFCPPPLWVRSSDWQSDRPPS